MIRTILLWLLLFPWTIKAQNTLSTADRERPPFALKTAPLEPLNYYQQSVALLADYSFTPYWGVDFGGSAVFNSWYMARNKGEHYRGVKARMTLKYYLFNSIRNNAYVGLTFKYNDIHHDYYVNVLRQGGQYLETLLEQRHLQTWGIGLRYGFKKYLGRREKWFIEPYTGFGFRQKRIRSEGLPPDAERLDLDRGFNFIREPGVYRVPDVMWGVYVGRVIGSH